MHHMMITGELRDGVRGGGKIGILSAGTREAKPAADARWYLG